MRWAWLGVLSADVQRRPVFERYLRRKHYMRLDPPTEAEKRDAILILRDTWEDELTEEAFRIFDEASQEER
jgi:hypothetical protein